MNSVKEYVSERDCVAKRGKALVKCHGKRIYFFPLFNSNSSNRLESTRVDGLRRPRVDNSP